MEKTNVAMEEEGNKADASSQRVILAKWEQTEDSGLYFGVGVRGGTTDAECRRGLTIVCSGKAVSVGYNILNLSLLWREIELYRGCRLYKASFTSNTKLICLRARCSPGNEGKLLQIMKPRRHVHVLGEWWREELILYLNSLREVICQHVIDKTSCGSKFMRETTVLENHLT